MQSPHGSSRWANILDLWANGLTRPGGLFLGRACGRDIYHNGPEHILTIAPPRSGKTSNLILPVLLSYRGSVVVTDPKAELTPMVIEARRRMGHRVVVLNPWQRQLREENGIDLPDTGFNPLAFLRDDYALHDNVRMVAQLLCPSRPDDRDPFWADSARAFLRGLLLYMVKAGEPLTLPRLRSLVRQDIPAMEDLAATMGELADSTGYAVLADSARELRSWLGSEKMWAGIQGHAQTVTDIYGAGDPLGDHVARAEFDPTDLKREKISLFIVVPSNRRDDAKGWLSLAMAMLGEAVGKPGRPSPVLFLGEEFGNLGVVGNIGRMLAEYPAAGVRCWLFCQSFQQLELIYGLKGSQNIAALCAVHQFFGVNEPTLLQGVSKRLGQKTEDVQARKDLFDGSPGYPPISQIGVPLLRPEEIEQRPRSHQIILRAGMRPIDGRLVYYKSRAAWAKAAGANPYDVRPAKRKRGWLW